MYLVNQVSVVLNLEQVPLHCTPFKKGFHDLDLGGVRASCLTE